MSANTAPIFPVAPLIGIATLTSPTAITSRANITGTTGLVQLTPTSTNGKRVDRIHMHSKGNSSAGSLFIWIYNGTTSYLYDEILVTAITASTTVASFDTFNNYTTLVLQPTYQVYISISVTQDANIFAFGGDY
jgi:hypothetical protein